MTQLSDRRLSLGGSDAAAAIGISPWKTPVALWEEKTGRREPADLADNEAVRWGTLLEPLIVDEYARRNRRLLTGRSVAVRSTEYGWMTGELDALAEGGVIVEAKAVGLRSAGDFGESGTDHVPQHYLAQAHHYLVATGLREVHFAVLIAGQEYRQFVVERDDELAGLLVDQEAAFWRCVETDTPPAPQDLDDCRRLWPRDNAARLTAADDVALACAELADIRRRQKAVEIERAGVELFIQAVMQEAAELADADGRLLATWKSQTSSRVDVAALAKAHPGIAAEFRRATQSRVFRLKGEA